MFKLLFRLIIGAVIFFGLIIMLGISFVGKAGNALLSSANSAIATAHGLAQMEPLAQGKGSNLQLRLDGLLPAKSYSVTLDQNSCGGPTYKYVGKLSTDSNGSVIHIFPLTNLQPSAQNQIWLDVRDNSGASVVCGQVQVNDNLVSQVTKSATSNTLSNGGLVNGFPQTGVAPGKHNSYNNHVFPRKY